jgi:hypothetical protein
VSDAPQLELLPPDYPEGVPLEVCGLFEKLSHELVDRGFERYSADAILHRIRWEMHIARGDRAFKANNNWTPALARWLMKRSPGAFGGFFELRERISE